MAVLLRQTQKVFAGNANASQIAVMGTMKTGTPVYNTSLATLQSAEYELGWDSAILNDKAPYLEEMNGVQYGFSYQIAYLLQEGIPEYDVNTNYSKTSIVKTVEDNNLVLYHSLIDDNQGVVDITNSADWARLYIVDFGKVGDPVFTLNNTLPDGLPSNTSSFIWLEGQAVSRTTYAALFAIYGTTYGAGDGSTTFNLPNFKNRAVWGADSLGYISAGLPTISATTVSNGAHTHTKGSMRITGKIETSSSDDEPLTFSDDISTTGAFAVGGKRENWAHGGAETKAGTCYNVFSFDSNRTDNTWTGSTSSNGNHNHTVNVSMSTSGIMGNSTTVQPPAIKVRVCTRWK